MSSKFAVFDRREGFLEREPTICCELARDFHNLVEKLFKEISQR